MEKNTEFREARPGGLLPICRECGTFLKAAFSHAFTSHCTGKELKANWTNFFPLSFSPFLCPLKVRKIVIMLNSAAQNISFWHNFFFTSTDCSVSCQLHDKQHSGVYKCTNFPKLDKDEFKFSYMHNSLSLFFLSCQSAMCLSSRAKMK